MTLTHTNYKYHITYRRPGSTKVIARTVFNPRTDSVSRWGFGNPAQRYAAEYAAEKGLENVVISIIGRKAR